MNKTQLLLLKLNEEATEIAKEAAKCMQFGFDSDYMGETNRQRLNDELNDLWAVLTLLRVNGDFHFALNEGKVDAKIEKICHFAAMSEKLGFVQEKNNVFESTGTDADIDLSGV